MQSAKGPMKGDPSTNGGKTPPADPDEVVSVPKAVPFRQQLERVTQLREARGLGNMKNLYAEAQQPEIQEAPETQFDDEPPKKPLQVDVGTNHMAMTELFQGTGSLLPDTHPEVMIPFELFESVQQRQKFYRDQYADSEKALKDTSAALKVCKQDLVYADERYKNLSTVNEQVTVRLEQMTTFNREMTAKRDAADKANEDLKDEVQRLNENIVMKENDRTQLRKRISKQQEDHKKAEKEKDAVIALKESLIADLETQLSASKESNEKLNARLALAVKTSVRKGTSSNPGSPHLGVKGSPVISMNARLKELSMNPSSAPKFGANGEDEFEEERTLLEEMAQKVLASKQTCTTSLMNRLEFLEQQLMATWDPEVVSGGIQKGGPSSPVRNPDENMVTQAKYESDQLEASGFEDETCPIDASSPFYSLWPRFADSRLEAVRASHQVFRTFERFEKTMKESLSVKELLDRWKKFSPRWKSNCEASTKEATLCLRDMMETLAAQEKVATKQLMDEAEEKFRPAEKFVFSQATNTDPPPPPTPPPPPPETTTTATNTDPPPPPTPPPEQKIASVQTTPVEFATEPSSTLSPKLPFGESGRKGRGLSPHPSSIAPKSNPIGGSQRIPTKDPSGGSQMIPTSEDPTGDTQTVSTSEPCCHCGKLPFTASPERSTSPLGSLGRSNAGKARKASIGTGSVSARRSSVGGKKGVLSDSSQRTPGASVKRTESLRQVDKSQTRGRSASAIALHDPEEEDRSSAATPVKPPSRQRTSREGRRPSTKSRESIVKKFEDFTGTMGSTGMESLETSTPVGTPSLLPRNRSESKLKTRSPPAKAIPEVVAVIVETCDQGTQTTRPKPVDLGSQTVERTEGTLFFPQLPEKFFEFHQDLIQFFQGVRKKIKVTFPVVDSAQFLLSDARTVGDIVCVLQLDHDLVLALQTAMDQGRTSGRAATQRLIDYKNKVDQLRLHALDMTTGESKEGLQRLDMMQRDELLKYRAKKADVERVAQGLPPLLRETSKSIQQEQEAQQRARSPQEGGAARSPYQTDLAAPQLPAKSPSGQWHANTPQLESLDPGPPSGQLVADSVPTLPQINHWTQAGRVPPTKSLTARPPPTDGMSGNAQRRGGRFPELQGPVRNPAQALLSRTTSQGPQSMQRQGGAGLYGNAHNRWQPQNQQQNQGQTFGLTLNRRR